MACLIGHSDIVSAAYRLRGSSVTALLRLHCAAETAPDRRALQDKGDLTGADVKFRSAIEASRSSRDGGGAMEALALGANHGVLLTRMGRASGAAALLRQSLAEAEVLARTALIGILHMQYSYICNSEICIIMLYKHNNNRCNQ